MYILHTRIFSEMTFRIPIGNLIGSFRKE